VRRCGRPELKESGAPEGAPRTAAIEQVHQCHEAPVLVERVVRP